jgi:hypothetical protein
VPVCIKNIDVRTALVALVGSYLDGFNAGGIIIIDAECGILDQITKFDATAMGCDDDAVVGIPFEKHFALLNTGSIGAVHHRAVGDLETSL